jgi:hypothetical protein
MFNVWAIKLNTIFENTNFLFNILLATVKQIERQIFSVKTKPWPG